MDFASKPSSEREHMFEKVVTPSDVGKLNRLVIPKQHAEKYFPLDSAGGEKGLLLNFDESAGTGKSWRFRYSYWSSSQSYVITKGWSRFVKDKNLFAGDVVSFLRDSGDGRFFIDWRRRPAESSRTQLLHGISLHRPIYPHHNLSSWCYNSSSVTPAPPSSLMVGPGFYNYGYGVISPNYSGLHNQFGASAGPTLFETVPAVAKESKRLRLFGVNMDCHVTSDDLVLPSPSSSSSAAALQLRLHGGDPTSSAATKIDLVTANFLDKGKSSSSPSSFSLDFGI